MEGGIERAGGKRDAEDVIADRPAEVLAHDAQRGTREAERGRNGFGLGAQQEHVAGFLREIGATAHGDSRIGLGESGGVIDAVADHGDAQAGLLQLANAGQLACRVEACFHLVDAGLLCNGSGGGGRSRR